MSVASGDSCTVQHIHRLLCSRVLTDKQAQIWCFQFTWIAIFCYFILPLKKSHIKSIYFTCSHTKNTDSVNQKDIYYLIILRLWSLRTFNIRCAFCIISYYINLLVYFNCIVSKVHFCKTTDQKLTRLHVSLGYIFYFSLVTTSCLYSVEFRHKKHLIRIRKTTWFGLKYLFCSPPSRTEMVRLK